MIDLKDLEEIEIVLNDTEEDSSLNEKNKNINTITIEQQLQFYISENERLKSIIHDLNKLIKDNYRLRQLLDYQERELNHYKKKDQKSRKKKYSISDLIELREKGYSYRKIAAHYKVSPSTIYYRLNKDTK